MTLKEYSKFVFRVIFFITFLIIAIISGYYTGLYFDIDYENGEGKKIVMGFENTYSVKLPEGNILLINTSKEYGAIKMIKRYKRSAKICYWYATSDVKTWDECEKGSLVLRDLKKIGNRKAKVVTPHLGHTFRFGSVYIGWLEPNTFCYGKEYGIKLVKESDIDKIDLNKEYNWTYLR